jgi:two-component system response regulator CssR
MDYKIFLVEDDENLNRLLKSYLEKEGWQVSSFLKGKEAQNVINDRPHLWILDIMLPDIDGYQIIKEIKSKTPEIPVIFISARDADVDKIEGLEMGSDDYLAKPFLPRELVIRVKKLLGRIYNISEGENQEIKSYGKYEINFDNRNVNDTAEDRQIELTSKEFDLLKYLINNRQQALSREQIIKAIWGQDYYGTDRVVDDMIRRLRKKMPLLNIETIYGYGYRLVKP